MGTDKKSLLSLDQGLGKKSPTETYRKASVPLHKAVPSDSRLLLSLCTHKQKKTQAQHLLCLLPIHKGGSPRKYITHIPIDSIRRDEQSSNTQN
jgi:hypothetical protein